MHDQLQRILAWYNATLATGGYPLIVLLMAMESTVFPLPSEFVVPTAAYLAHTQGRLSLVGVVIASVFGSWLGATIMYWASRWAGRPIVVSVLTRFGRYFGMPPEKLDLAERWSARFGGMGVFISRMLPVIRHLIGIPSGIVRLNYFKYSLYTVLGSLIWCSILAAVGVAVGANQDVVTGDMTAITLKLVIPACLILGGLYYFFVYRIARSERA